METDVQLHAAIDAVVDAVVVIDAAGRVVHANSVARGLFGFDAQPDILGLPAAERAARYGMRDEHGRLFEPDHLPVARVLRGDTLTGAGAVEARLHALDGRLLQLSVTGRPIYADDGRIDGAVLIARDLTAHRHLEQRTREALDTLLAMAEALVHGNDDAGNGGAAAVGRRLAELTRGVLACRQVAIVALDPHSDALLPVATAGFSPEHETRWLRQWARHPHLADRLEAAHIAQLQRDEVLLLDRTRPPFSSETAFGRRLVLMVPLRVNSRLTGVMSIDHGSEDHAYTSDDIALSRAVGRLAALVIERERLLREREEARAGELALREANRRMDEFLSIASHELRTPLTTVLGAVQLSRRRLQKLAASQSELLDVPAAARAIDDILARGEAQTLRLNSLVHELLDVSRIQADHLSLSLSALDLRPIAGDAVEEQRHAWSARVITLEAPEQPVLVEADAGRIHQVLTNYLTNALKYSDRVSPVAVTIAVDGENAVVRVRDEGPGLTPEQQIAVWGRFYRAGNIDVRSDSGDVGGGLGLGLYISRTIVERHGGRVGVDSTPGAGSTFWLALRMAEDGHGDQRRTD